MRVRLPSSLSGRLVVVAATSTSVAVVLACVIMGVMLHRFVVGQINQRLDTQAFAIAESLRAGGNGTMDVQTSLLQYDAPPFDRPRSGWTWRVDGPSGRVASSDQAGKDLPLDLRPLEGPTPPPPPEELSEAPDMPPSDAPGAHRPNESLHVKTFGVRIGDESLTITVTAPKRAIYDPLRDVLVPLLLSMLGLGLVLVASTFLQVRVGLRPLEHLRRSLREVRMGAIARIPPDQPREVAPVAEELNSLIDDNIEGLARARRHVANLAHGLKTPLAELAMTIQEPGRDPDGSAAALVEAMDQRVRHHLARARVAAVAGSVRAATPVRQHVTDLVDVLARIHADRPLSFEIDVSESAVVGAEAQDLDEMLGNLLDNACKWARSVVRVGAKQSGSSIAIVIDDDGNGIEPSEMPEALRPGRRLDEMMPGHGFGLPITRELAELYGGALTIGRSTLGGLSVTLKLPAPSG